MPPHSEKQGAQHPYPCLDCGSTTGPAVLFCGPCWVGRREKGRRPTGQENGAAVGHAGHRRARAEARLVGALCSVHGAATAWTVNARGDSWCSLCFPAGRPA